MAASQTLFHFGALDIAKQICLSKASNGLLSLEGPTQLPQSSEDLLVASSLEGPF